MMWTVRTPLEVGDLRGMSTQILASVPAIVEALQDGKIRCRVYRKDKFHAKIYLTHAGPPSSAHSISRLLASTETLN